MGLINCSKHVTAGVSATGPRSFRQDATATGTMMAALEHLAAVASQREMLKMSVSTSVRSSAQA